MGAGARDTCGAGGARAGQGRASDSMASQNSLEHSSGRCHKEE